MYGAHYGQVYLEIRRCIPLTAQYNAGDRKTETETERK